MKLACSGKIYFRAPKGMVDKHCIDQECCQRLGEADSPPRKTLTKAALSRLDEHLFALEAEGAASQSSPTLKTLAT